MMLKTTLLPNLLLGNTIKIEINVQRKRNKFIGNKF